MPRIRKAEQGGGPWPVLIVLCGPSHAGKSTFARRFCKDFKIISTDRIRKQQRRSFACSREERKVWEAFESEKRKALREGHDVVLDACHISERARRHALQGPNTHHRKICIVFDLPLATIRQRCLKDRRLSVMEAERMWKAFQDAKPTARQLRREGFDEVYFFVEKGYPNAGRPPW